MKQKLYLHIGMGKTGTTALQEYFWLNRKALYRRGICYPRYGTKAHAHHLLSPHVPPDLSSEWKFQAVAAWAPKLQRLKVDTLLLSSELIAWTPSADVAKFCHEVCRFFDLKVVIYLRRQDEIIMANYNQLVKAGRQRNELGKVLENQQTHFEYLQILEPWAQALGNENIIVRPYEKMQFFGGDIFQDFLHHTFGIEVNDEFSLPVGASNPRLSFAALEYKRHLNALIPEPAESSRFTQVLLEYSANSPALAVNPAPDQSLLSPAQRVQILQRSLAANQKIARDFLHRDDGVLFQQEIPDIKDSWSRPQLTVTETSGITRFIQANDSGAYRMLLAAVSQQGRSLRPAQAQAANFFKKSMPFGSITMLRLRNTASRKLRWPQPSVGSAQRLMVISVHFPMVAVPGYEELIAGHFGSQLIRDYEDRPMRLSGAGRIVDALRKGLPIALSDAPRQRNTCVHGHFLPVKYLLPGRGPGKRFVTWMSNPVERLVAHYSHLQGNNEGSSAGGIQRLMQEENWSLETFFFRPEFRNIYSRFLWGFPLSRFDFIGISEFHEADLQRFSREILGCDLEAEFPAVEPNSRCSELDPHLRSRVERYHSADMALYRRAVALRP